jgi:hypothetical protein
MSGPLTRRRLLASLDEDTSTWPPSELARLEDAARHSEVARDRRNVIEGQELLGSYLGSGVTYSDAFRAYMADLMASPALLPAAPGSYSPGGTDDRQHPKCLRSTVTDHDLSAEAMFLLDRSLRGPPQGVGAISKGTSVFVPNAEPCRPCAGSGTLRGAP